MIEVSNTTIQTVPINGAVAYNTQDVRSCNAAERWRAGSANITLTKTGRYLVTFSGNIAVPTGQTVGEVSLGLAQDGEVLGGSIMRVTPAAVEEYFNVSSQHYVDVYCGCCVNVAIENTSAIPVNVDNPNLTAVRVCGNGGV